MKKINLISVVSENQIQNSICDYLAIKRCFFWRQNTSGIFDSKSGTHRSLPKYAMSGIPDIILIKNGKFIGLEVKKEKGKQSEKQKLFEIRCKMAGGEYHIVKSIEDIIKLGI